MKQSLNENDIKVISLGLNGYILKINKKMTKNIKPLVYKYSINEENGDWILYNTIDEANQVKNLILQSNK